MKEQEAIKNERELQRQQAERTQQDAARNR